MNWLDPAIQPAETADIMQPAAGMLAVLGMAASRLAMARRRRCASGPGRILTSSTISDPPRHSAGFTLLEVLIAFIIAGAAIAALMQAGAIGLRATRDASLQQEAVARARSHLDAAVHGAELVAGDNQGDDGGGYRWRVRVTPTATTALQPHGTAGRSGIPVTLYAVSVWIAWRDGGSSRDVRLDTEQVGEGGQ
jgi:general secretion pathway protein I